MDAIMRGKLADARVCFRWKASFATRERKAGEERERHE